MASLQGSYGGGGVGKPSDFAFAAAGGSSGNYAGPDLEWGMVDYGGGGGVTCETDANSFCNQVTSFWGRIYSLCDFVCLSVRASVRL